MILWAALLLSTAAHAEPNELWKWVAAYKDQRPAHMDDGYTANWRRELDPILRKFEENPGLFPIVPVAKHFTDVAKAEVGQGCLNGAPAGSEADRAFQLNTECLWHALALHYDKDAAGAAAKALSMPREADLSKPTSDDATLTASSVMEAAQAYRAIDGGSLNYNDPGGNDEGLLDRAVMTGNGHFAPDSVIYTLRSKLESDLFSDRGRSAAAAKDCAGKLTLAELYYHALRASEGSLPVAAGAISAVLHDERKIADCIAGLRRSQNEYKDYYRFAGLYIGLQEATLKRKAASGLAQTQTAVYGVIRQVQYDLKGEPMKGTERAGFATKFPELYVGLEAADAVRAKGL